MKNNVISVFCIGKWIARALERELIRLLEDFQGYRLLVPVAVGGCGYIDSAGWPQFGWDWTLGTVAVVHTAGVFVFLVYLIVHVYMITTGHTVGSHLKAMVTGYENIEAGD